MLDEPKKPKADSRRKGADFERKIAGVLLGLTGVNFKRNLVQTQEAGHSDLIPDDPAWPFSLELKRYQKGTRCAPAWRKQAENSAKRDGKLPAVVYKFDNIDVMVSVPISALGYGIAGHWIELTLETFAYVAAEIMAERAMLEH